MSKTFGVCRLIYELSKLLVAAFVLLFIGAYVWLLQKGYDAADKKHEWTVIPFYGSILLGAGLAYDCAKRVLLLPRTAFAVFGRNGLWGLLWLLAGALFCAPYAYLYDPNTLLGSYVAYIMGVLPILLSNHYLGQALGVAISGNADGLNASETPAQPDQAT